MLFGILIISILLLIILITSLTLALLGRKWDGVREFFYGNYSFFEILFVIVYFGEQFIFIVLSYFFREYNVLLAGIFAIVVISTVSLQGVMMECKNKRVNTLLAKNIVPQVTKLKEEYEREFVILQKRIKMLQKEKENLIDYIQNKLTKKSKVK